MNKSKSILTLLIATFLVFYVSSHWESFRKLEITHPWYLAIGIGANVFTLYLQGLIGSFVFRLLGSSISMRESIALGIMTNLTNFFLPFRGGLAARAVYLKKVHNLTYDRFFSSVLSYYIPNIIITALFAVISVYELHRLKPDLSNYLLLMGSIACFAAGLFMVLGAPIPKSFRRKWRTARKLYEALRSWHGIKDDRTVILQLTGLTILDVITSIVLTFAVYAAFGITFTLTEITALTTITNISGLLSITPSNLGISEAVGVFVTNSMSVSAAEVIAVTMLTRFLFLFTIAATGPIASYYLSSQVARSRNNKVTAEQQ